MTKLETILQFGKYIFGCVGLYLLYQICQLLKELVNILK